MAHKQMKRFSTAANRDIQIKVTMRLSLHTTKIAPIKKTIVGWLGGAVS